MVLRVIPVIIAALILAAHFLRAGNFVVMAACLLAPLLLLIRERWSLIVLQVLAYVGAGLWLTTILEILQQRLRLGLPWTRLVLILGGVALFTLIAGLLLNSAAVKEKYPP
jgi:hypothetical protein